MTTEQEAQLCGMLQDWKDGQITIEVVVAFVYRLLEKKRREKNVKQ